MPARSSARSCASWPGAKTADRFGPIDSDSPQRPASNGRPRVGDLPMMRDLFYGVSEQGKAGKHRLDDARALLNAVRWRGAMDMAGYAVECLIKTKLMRMFDCRHLRELEDELQRRGVLPSHATIFTHQLEVLLRLTQGLDPLRQNEEPWRLFNIVNPGCRPGATPLISRTARTPRFFWKPSRKSHIGSSITFAGDHNMADSQLKQKIHDVLKAAYFKDLDDLVDVSDGPDDSIHVVIVSRKFDGRRMKEKNDLIWSVLVGNLQPRNGGRSRYPSARARKKSRPARWEHGNRRVGLAAPAGHRWGSNPRARSGFPAHAGRHNRPNFG